MERKKRKYLFPKLTALLLLVTSILITSIYNTYAWAQVSSKKGIYPFYNVEMTTPTDSFYIKVEVATGEEYNEETNDYDFIYEDIDKVNLSDKLVYPGDRLNFRFKVYNFGGQSTSISIYFKDIVDTKIKGTNNFFSKDIILGSPSFNGNDGGVNNNYGFLFYAGERLSYDESYLSPISIENTVCDGVADCYKNKSSLIFAQNVGIIASPYTEGKTESYYNQRLEEIRNSSDDYEGDRKKLVYECFVPTELDWYILIDRATTVETAQSLFSIGSILFAVD